eukprot:618783-Rhodomonas_salina.3
MKENIPISVQCAPRMCLAPRGACTFPLATAHRTTGLPNLRLKITKRKRRDRETEKKREKDMSRQIQVPAVKSSLRAVVNSSTSLADCLGEAHVMRLPWKLHLRKLVPANPASVPDIA